MGERAVAGLQVWELEDGGVGELPRRRPWPRRRGTSAGEEEVKCEYPRACNVPAGIIHGEKTSGTEKSLFFPKNSRLFSLLVGFPQPTFTNFSLLKES